MGRTDGGGTDESVPPQDETAGQVGLDALIGHLVECRQVDSAVVGDTGVDMTDTVASMIAAGWRYEGTEYVAGKRIRYLVAPSDSGGTDSPVPPQDETAGRGTCDGVPPLMSAGDLYRLARRMGLTGPAAEAAVRRAMVRRADRGGTDSGVPPGWRYEGTQYVAGRPRQDETAGRGTSDGVPPRSEGDVADAGAMLPSEVAPRTAYLSGPGYDGPGSTESWPGPTGC